MLEKVQDFKNGRTDIHNYDRTSQPSTPRTNMNAARVEELFQENGRVTIRDILATL
jgi:hypothetical protein